MELKIIIINDLMAKTCQTSHHINLIILIHWMGSIPLSSMFERRVQAPNLLKDDEKPCQLITA